MKLPCASQLPLLLVLLLGCGPGEIMTPPLEPEGAASPSASAAHSDTHGCLGPGAETLSPDGSGPAPACCAGLTRVPVYKGSIIRLDTCEVEDDRHAFCIRCGDGVCGVGENTCSCAADCHWP